MNFPTLFLTALLLGSAARAHEGHVVPGALPPAPHGGVVAPTEEKGELYFEAVYRDKTIRVYPLTLPPGEHHAFRTLTAKKDLSDVSVKVEVPRTRRVETVRPVLGVAIEIPFDAGSAHRFLVHLEVRHGKVKKKAKIQIETDG